MIIVCPYCADRLPRAPTSVQPSDISIHAAPLGEEGLNGDHHALFQHALVCRVKVAGNVLGGFMQASLHESEVVVDSRSPFFGYAVAKRRVV